jgi:hypothetical protein
MSQCDRRREPGGDTVLRTGVLSDQPLEPPQCFELAANQTSSAGSSFGVRAGTVGFDEGCLLLGLREVLETALSRERGEARQPWGLLDIVSIDQDQTRRSGPGMPACRSGELGAHARDRRPHLPQILVLAFGPEIPVPAGASIDPLDHRAHEREVARGEFALAGGYGHRPGASASALSLKRTLR